MVHVGELLPQGDPPLAELLLDRCETGLPVRRGVLRRLRDRGRLDLLENGLAEADFGTAGDQLSLPFDRSGCWDFGHDADGDVEHETCLRVVRLAHFDQVGVEVRPHFGGLQVRPGHVHRLGELVGLGVRDEPLRDFGRWEEYLNGPGPVREEPPPGRQRQLTQRLLLLLRRRQDLPAQRPDARKQAQLPMLLPMRPATLPRAVNVRAIVAVLVLLAGIARLDGDPSAFRVPAFDDVASGGLRRGRCDAGRRVETDAPLRRGRGLAVGLANLSVYSLLLPRGRLAAFATSSVVLRRGDVRLGVVRIASVRRAVAWTGIS